MLGIDEVGRGAWAGPLLVCAARLKKGKRHLKGLTDSKLLTKKQRESMIPAILDLYEIGEGWVSAAVIDEMGLSKALKCACLLAVLKLDTDREEKIVLDGNVDFFKDTIYQNVFVQKKADMTVPQVSAASIYAKVLRDNLMTELSEEFPEYGWDSNVGYGTKKHLQEITSYGLTKHHRRSYKIPI